MDLILTPAKQHPPHVPASLAFDFDMYHLPEAFSQSPHAYWKTVQEQYPPIFWSSAYGGHWVATRGDDIKTIQADHERFSNYGSFIPTGIIPTVIPVQLDPPEHLHYRKIIMPAFMPRSLIKVEEQARLNAIAIIEELKPQGGCEFVSEFSGVMPIIAFLSLAGLPSEDAPMLRAWASMMTPTTNPLAPQGWANITDYVKKWIAIFKEQPGEGLISTIVHARVQDRPLTDEEILSMCQLVVGGGLDTVVLMTSFIAHHLATHPQDRNYLRQHPERLQKAVEEFARRFGTSNLARDVRMDLTYAGVDFKKGEQILLPFPLYGLDERLTRNALHVDLTRDNAQHTAFGSGVHSCVGAALARREIRIFLEEWLQRIPDFRIKPGTTPTFETGIINTISNLQLEWDVPHSTTTTPPH